MIGARDIDDDTVMGTTYTGRRRDFMEAFGQYSSGQSIVPYVGGVIEGPQEPESDDFIL